jgi:hypothetical protein
VKYASQIHQAGTINTIFDSLRFLCKVCACNTSARGRRLALDSACVQARASICSAVSVPWRLSESSLLRPREWPVSTIGTPSVCATRLAISPASAKHHVTCCAAYESCAIKSVCAMRVATFPRVHHDNSVKLPGLSSRCSLPTIGMHQKLPIAHPHSGRGSRTGRQAHSPCAAPPECRSQTRACCPQTCTHCMLALASVPIQLRSQVRPVHKSPGANAWRQQAMHVPLMVHAW